MTNVEAIKIAFKCMEARQEQIKREKEIAQDIFHACEHGCNQAETDDEFEENEYDMDAAEGDLAELDKEHDAIKEARKKLSALSHIR